MGYYLGYAQSTNIKELAALDPFSTTAPAATRMIDASTQSSNDLGADQQAKKEAARRVHKNVSVGTR